MSLMQVLTRDSFQSSTTPYAFFGSSSSFLQDSKDNPDTDFSYFPPPATSARAGRGSLPPAEDVGSEQFVVEAGTVEDLQLSSRNSSSSKDKSAPTSWDESLQQAQQQHQSSTSMHNLHHVAQQSRREKLRISGSLQPASPNHSEHSAPSGSLVLEMRQQGGGGASEMHPAPGDGLNPDMLSVYSNPILPPEVYSYTTGSELLNAVSGKNQSYMLTGGDGLPNSVYPPQAGFGANQNLQKGGGSAWSSNLNAQLGQFNANSLSVSVPQSTSAAALLVGPGMQPASAFGSTTGRDLGSYFTGANAQEAMQLYLMNAAGFSGYPDGAGGAAGSMVFIPGPSSAGQQTLGGSTAQNIISSQVTSVSGNSPVGFQGGRGGGQAYTSWKTGDELVFLPASERAKPFGGNQDGGLNDLSSDYGASMAAAGQQHVGSSQLSLSLSSQQPQSLHAYDVLQQSGLDSPAGLSQDGKRSVGGGKLAADLSHFRRDFQGKQIHIDGVGGSSAMSASFNIISSSRYLKACQQLLEEVCSVGKGVKSGGRSKSLQWNSGPSPLTSPTSANNNKDGGVAGNAGTARDEQGSDPEAKDGGATNASAGTTTGNNSSGTSGAGGGAATVSGAGEAAAAAASTAADQGVESTSALSSEEKQELETKKTKLINMLQEVDRRYRQYYDQMQVVISSFDAVAGVGAATPYTALALQAMSRYFRCLKDAITGQISLVCKSLGEEDISKQITTKSPTSRLRFIDQQIRQQRAFQQLGMLNQHAWRPQRGLPERSVSILRAWLFEHFLHPYPKDADKMMLARQTGLTRSQVSNWFINARVRLWKPMVEEMYQDETREHELDVAVSRMHAAAAAADSDVDGTTTNLTNTTELNDPNKSKLSDSSDHFVHDHQSTASQSDHFNSLRKQNLAPDSSQLYEESEQQQQLKKSRYSTDADHHLLSSSHHHHHMDVDLKPDQDMHQLANGGALQHFGYDQQLRFASAAAAAGFRYNVAPGGSGGVSLTLGLQHSDGLTSPQAYMQHGGAAAAAAAAAGFHLSKNVNNGGNSSEHDFSSLYENAGLHDGMSYTSRKHMESQLLHDFVPS